MLLINGFVQNRARSRSSLSSRARAAQPLRCAPTLPPASMTVPNLITIARLIMVPLVIVMIGQGRWMTAFVLFVAAGVSDGVDGYIAKRFDMRSELGAYLDPLADKALLVSIYVTLSVTGVLPGWLAVTVVSRDIMIVAAIIVSRLMERPVAIKPLFISKLN